MTKLEVAIAAGGTAGHVNPALALAEELRDRGHNVRFYGQTRRLEGKLVPEAGFELVPIDVTGFDRSRPWTLITALHHIAAEKRRLLKLMDTKPEYKPDVAIGFGAYIELPLMQAAHSKHIPIVLHEQNSVPGLANKQSAKNAQVIAIAQPAVQQIFDAKKGPQTQIEVIGNPVRRSVLCGDARAGRERLGIPEDAFVLLVFGGSLGAAHLNAAITDRAHELLANSNVHIIHSTGEADFDKTVEAVKSFSAEEQARYHVRPYIDDMGDMLAGADACVSRSGASSVAEISALAVPAILVPYPHATADHQTTNARFLVESGAAVLVKDDQLDGDGFTQQLNRLIEDDEYRLSMRASAQGLAQDQAALRLADVIERVACS